MRRWVQPLQCPLFARFPPIPPPATSVQDLSFLHLDLARRKGTELQRRVPDICLRLNMESGARGISHLRFLQREEVGNGGVGVTMRVSGQPEYPHVIFHGRQPSCCESRDNEGHLRHVSGESVGPGVCVNIA